MALAEHGADVAINHISSFDAEIGIPDAAQKFVDEAESHGVKAFAIEGDVSVDGAILDVYDRAVEALERVDILVSNANIQIPCAFEDVNSGTDRLAMPHELPRAHPTSSAGVTPNGRARLGPGVDDGKYSAGESHD